MFNFFNEIKSGIKNLDIKNSYNIVNVSGKICYIEGHKGLKVLSRDVIVVAIKNGDIKVTGKDLVLRELYDECIKISGKIKNIEVEDAQE